MPKIVHVLIIRHKVHSGTYTISCYIVKYMLIVYFDIVYYRWIGKVVRDSYLFRTCCRVHLIRCGDVFFFTLTYYISKFDAGKSIL